MALGPWAKKSILPGVGAPCRQRYAWKCGLWSDLPRQFTKSAIGDDSSEDNGIRPNFSPLLLRTNVLVSLLSNMLRAGDFFIR